MQLVLNANACSFAKLCCCAFFALIVQPCVLGGVSGLVALSGRGRRVNELGPGVILFQGLQSWRKPLHLLPRLLSPHAFQRYCSLRDERYLPQSLPSLDPYNCMKCFDLGN